jgi:hypothetical protein
MSWPMSSFALYRGRPIYATGGFPNHQYPQERFMKLFNTTVFVVVVASLAPLSVAAATPFSYNWLGADTVLGVPNTRPVSNLTDEVKFTAESVVRFTDTDSSGTITAGDTFRDSIVLRFDQLFFNGNNNGETNAGYGTTREITLTAQFSGTQVSSNNYVLNPGETVKFFYDSGSSGFTPAIFGNLSTFVDHNGGPALLVETGATIPPSGGLNSSFLPDGTIDINVFLNDTLVPGGFELSAPGSTFLGNKLGQVDANNAVCTDSGGRASCFSTTAAINNFFSTPALAVGQFEFHTRSDGSLTKTATVLAVPEPSSVGLFAAGLVGLGVVIRRRKGT